MEVGRNLFRLGGLSHSSITLHLTEMLLALQPATLGKGDFSKLLTEADKAIGRVGCELQILSGGGLDEAEVVCVEALSVQLGYHL